MRERSASVEREPALSGLGPFAAIFLPAEAGAGAVILDGGADRSARLALARLSLDAALARLPAGGPDGAGPDGAGPDEDGLWAEAGPLLTGLPAPVCAARRTEDGLLVLLAWGAGVPRGALRAAFDALWRAARRSRGEAPSPFEAIFENAAQCMAVVGRDRRLLAVNRAGRRLLAEGRVVTEAGGRLRAADPEDDRRLGAALEEAAGREAPRSLVLAGRGGGGGEGGPGLRCDLGPIDLPPGAGEEGARLLLTATPVAEAPLEALLRRRYRLTPSEARLAGLIASGRDLREASEITGVSHHTARKYLQIAFSKIGVRRQADLQPPHNADSELVVLAAARLGRTRLIDNVEAFRRG